MGRFRIGGGFRQQRATAPRPSYNNIQKTAQPAPQFALSNKSASPAPKSSGPAKTTSSEAKAPGSQKPTPGSETPKAGSAAKPAETQKPASPEEIKNSKLAEDTEGFGREVLRDLGEVGPLSREQSKQLGENKIVDGLLESFGDNVAAESQNLGHRNPGKNLSGDLVDFLGKKGSDNAIANAGLKTLMDAPGQIGRQFGQDLTKNFFKDGVSGAIGTFGSYGRDLAGIGSAVGSIGKDEFNRSDFGKKFNAGMDTLAKWQQVQGGFTAATDAIGNFFGQ